MEFTQLQQSWQQQAAPTAASTPAAEASSLLADTERLHQFGRRQNWLGTGLVTLALACYLVPLLLERQGVLPAQWLGFGLLVLALGGYAAATWWGTTLRRAVQPGQDTQAYLRASLRAFRFRRRELLQLSIPYTLGMGLGLLLLLWPRFQAQGHPVWWKIGLWTALIAVSSITGRYFGLLRYEKRFGPTERELARWQRALLAES